MISSLILLFYLSGGVLGELVDDNFAEELDGTRLKYASQTEKRSFGGGNAYSDHFNGPPGNAQQVYGPQVQRDPQAQYGHPQQYGGHWQQEGGHPQQYGGHWQQEGGHPQQYGGHWQQEGGHPQQYGGHWQQEGGQPQQYGGHWQQEGGHPQHQGGHPQQYVGHSPHYGAQHHPTDVQAFCHFPQSGNTQSSQQTQVVDCTHNPQACSSNSNKRTCYQRKECFKSNCHYDGDYSPSGTCMTSQACVRLTQNTAPAASASLSNSFELFLAAFSVAVTVILGF